MSRSPKYSTVSVKQEQEARLRRERAEQARREARMREVAEEEERRKNLEEARARLLPALAEIKILAENSREAMLYDDAAKIETSCQKLEKTISRASRMRELDSYLLKVFIEYYDLQRAVFEVERLASSEFGSVGKEDGLR